MKSITAHMKPETLSARFDTAVLLYNRAVEDYNRAQGFTKTPGMHATWVCVLRHFWNVTEHASRIASVHAVALGCARGVNKRAEDYLGNPKTVEQVRRLPVMQCKDDDGNVRRADPVTDEGQELVRMPISETIYGQLKRWEENGWVATP